MEWHKTLLYGGINSKDFGIYVLNAKVDDSVSRDYELLTVPGRNGELHIDNGRYNNTRVTYTCAIVGDADVLLQGYLANMLNLNGYQRLEDDVHPEYYREAIFEGSVEPRMFDMRNKGIFDLVFNCKPQKYLKAGEDPFSVSNQTAYVNNPTLFPSKPLIKVTGTGAFTIATYHVTVSSNSGNRMVIDCDLQDAYDSSSLLSMNSDITLSPNEFPQIPAGDNITIVVPSGMTLAITPRWWTI